MKALAIIMMVTYADGNTEEFAYGTADEANAFVHSVQLYQEAGVGDPDDDWYADIVRIMPRPAFPMAN